MNFASPHPTTVMTHPRRYALIVLLLAAFLISLACSETKSTPNATAPKGPPPAPVTIGKTTLQDIPLSLQSIGRVESFSTVTIRAQVSGKLLQVHFKEGDEVKAGQLLFSIDPAPFQAVLDKAEAQLLKDKALARSAEQDLSRYAELVKKDYITRQQYDQAQANVDALKATLKADEAAIRSARLDLEYCSIYSPLSGRTGEYLINTGNLINANSTALVNIDQVHPVYVNFTIPEQYLPELRKFMTTSRLPVTAAIPGTNIPDETGHLSFLDSSVSDTTGTILLKGTFDNPHSTLWPGQFVTAQLTLTMEKGVTVVPSAAVQTSQKGQYVYVVNPDMTVTYRTVVIDRTLDGMSVVQKGLAPGETVVVDGQLRLTDGAPVTIKPPVTAEEESQ